MISNVETQRKRVGLTQIELSERVGVSRRALSSIEKSVAVPSVDIALKLALALNTSVEDLFSLDESLSIENNTPTTLPLEVTSIPSPSNKWEEFTFIDLFAGIGGIRLGFVSV
ncbi:MAG: helix-turn-helix domain-containing protein, partial [Firmicutes bacterium]|nr:helix-turn-helix domain-containing protein [Bacillota bacterium]